MIRITLFKRLTKLPPPAIIIFIGVLLLSACGGGSGTAPTTILGGAVKGPLANAVVEAFSVDTTASDLKGVSLGVGSTDGTAAIAGLTIPGDTSGLVLLEFTANADTVDITTGTVPILTTLQTLFDASRARAGESIYATPLTSIAVRLAYANADKSLFGGNVDSAVSEAELATALVVAGNQVASTLGFGLLDNTVDIFSTPPVLTNSDTTEAKQLAVLKHRTALEALSAIIAALQNDAKASNAATTLSNDGVVTALAADLQDGTIDGKNNSVTVPAFTDVSAVATVVTQNPGTLTVPGTSISVNAIETVLAGETTTTGVTVVTTLLTDGSIDVTPVSASVDPDSDLDGVKDADDNCPTIANTNQANNDNDNIGNACEVAVWDQFNWGGANWQ